MGQKYWKKYSYLNWVSLPPKGSSMAIASFNMSPIQSDTHKLALFIWECLDELTFLEL